MDSTNEKMQHHDQQNTQLQYSINWKQAQLALEAFSMLLNDLEKQSEAKKAKNKTGASNVYEADAKLVDAMFKQLRQQFEDTFGFAP